MLSYGKNENKMCTLAKLFLKAVESGLREPWALRSSCDHVIVSTPPRTCHPPLYISLVEPGSMINGSSEARDPPFKCSLCTGRARDFSCSDTGSCLGGFFSLSNIKWSHIALTFGCRNTQKKGRDVNSLFRHSHVAKSTVKICCFWIFINWEK